MASFNSRHGKYSTVSQLTAANRNGPLMTRAPNTDVDFYRSENSNKLMYYILLYIISFDIITCFLDSRFQEKLEFT